MAQQNHAFMDAYHAPYKKETRYCMDWIESTPEVCFISHFCLMVTYHVNKSMQREISHTFIGIGFATFICIDLYHIYIPESM